MTTQVYREILKRPLIHLNKFISVKKPQTYNLEAPHGPRAAPRAAPHDARDSGGSARCESGSARCESGSARCGSDPPSAVTLSQDVVRLLSLLIY